MCRIITLPLGHPRPTPPTRDVLRLSQSLSWAPVSPPGAGVNTLFVEHADAGMAGVWAFLVAAPTSLLFVILPGPLAWTGKLVGAGAHRPGRRACHAAIVLL